MIGVATAIVSHGGSDVLRNRRQIAQQVLDRGLDSVIRRLPYLNRMLRQRHCALAAVALSPSAAMEVAATALAGTDAIAIERYVQSTREYREHYCSFVRRQITDIKNWSRDQLSPFREQMEAFPDALGRVTESLLAMVVQFALCYLLAVRTFSRYEVGRG